MKITVLNGSLGGARGNTGAALAVLLRELEERGAETQVLELNGVSGIDPLLPFLRECDGFVFCTGTYWDSWGSPLQKFLEEATQWEAGPLWLGKPAACLVTMHSVGGKEVLSRLQGVLCTLGCLIPPMSGMVYSLANDLALRAPASEFHADLWQLEDLRVVAHNLLEAVRNTEPLTWKTWPVDSGDSRRPWLTLK